MFYYVYRITNKLNHKFYIGMHSSKTLNNSYYGSGKLIKQAIRKYGKENFIKDILFVFTSKEDMFRKEAELVNEEFLKNEYTYNINLGGYGGSIRGFTDEERYKSYLTCSSKKLGIFNPIYEEKRKKAILDKGGAFRHLTKEQRLVAQENSSRKCKELQVGIYSKETREKIKTNLKNMNWVVKDGIAKRVKKEEVESLLLLGWRLGRK